MFSSRTNNAGFFNASDTLGLLKISHRIKSRPVGLTCVTFYYCTRVVELFVVTNALEILLVLAFSACSLFIPNVYDRDSHIVGSVMGSG